MYDTDEIDHITAEEHKDLMGYCDHCQKWDEAKEKTHNCGSLWSTVIGKQLTTKRTFGAVKR